MDTITDINKKQAADGPIATILRENFEEEIRIEMTEKWKEILKRPEIKKIIEKS